MNAYFLVIRLCSADPQLLVNNLGHRLAAFTPQREYGDRRTSEALSEGDFFPSKITKSEMIVIREIVSFFIYARRSSGRRITVFYHINAFRRRRFFLLLIASLLPAFRCECGAISDDRSARKAKNNLDLTQLLGIRHDASTSHPQCASLAADKRKIKL